MLIIELILFRRWVRSSSVSTVGVCSPTPSSRRVAAVEVKFTLQSISVGGRRERDQGQYWYYKLRVQTVQLYYCKQQKLEGEWSGNDRG